MRTYWTANGLAARGHEVHVITNAREVRPPYRMLMRPEDWRRCDGRYGKGSVQVHWTDPADRSQSYVPMASPFVSKLAAIAARLHETAPFDVILSHYLEPYGVAGYLASHMTNAPHVARMAGSDAGRLWHHPQLEALYDHVLRSADTVIAARTVAERAIKHGVDPARIVPGGDFVVPDDVFAPEGPRLDLESLRRDAEGDPELRDLVWGNFAGDRPYFGIYGKLGETKGSFALLAALQRLKQAGHQVGLVALAHGPPEIEKRFRTRARRLGLEDQILQLPFLPHWRVPEFIRACLAVCCLEQDFPISFHSPIIPREVLLCGGCLVAATEIIRKMPDYEKLPHAYGCIAIPDVNDVTSLANALAAILNDPTPIEAMGMRGRAYALEMQDAISFPQQLEIILLDTAARRQRQSVCSSQPAATNAPPERERFSLTQLAARACGYSMEDSGGALDLASVRETLKIVETKCPRGLPRASFAAAIRAEIAIAEAEDEIKHDTAAQDWDALFRLQTKHWALHDETMDDMVPVRSPNTRLVSFDFDVSAFRTVQTAADFPADLPHGPSYLVVTGSGGPDGTALLVDQQTAAFLDHCDGGRTVKDIIRDICGATSPAQAKRERDWIENLFRRGFIALFERQVTRLVPPERRWPPDTEGLPRATDA